MTVLSTLTDHRDPDDEAAGGRSDGPGRGDQGVAVEVAKINGLVADY